MPSLRDQAIRGVFWSAVQNWGSAALGTLVFVILLRLLDAEQFGLLALAAVVVNFMEIFLRQGFGQAIVQRQDLEPGHLHTAFWINMVAAVILTLVAVVGADLAAAAFHEPGLAPVIRWLSLALPIGALNATPQAILQRDLAFKSLAIRSLVGVAAGGIVGIAMALGGYGVWSLVGQQLTAAAIGTIVLWTATGFRPGLTVSARHFRDLLRFGAHVVGAELLAFLNQRLDRVLIGLFVGMQAVGYYDVAQRLLLVMTQVLTQTVSTVALSALSKLQENREQMRSAFCTASRMTAAIAFPAFLGMAALSPEMVTVLFGPKWTPSIPIMQILVFIGILQSVTFFDGVVILACGKPAWRLAILLVNSLMNVAALSIAARWGVVAVAAAFVIRGYVLWPLPALAVRNLIHLDTRGYLDRFAAPTAASVTMVIVVLAVRRLLGPVTTTPIVLAAGIVAGVATYALVIHLLAPGLARQMRDFATAAVARTSVPTNG